MTTVLMAAKLILGPVCLYAFSSGVLAASTPGNAVRTFLGDTILLAHDGGYTFLGTPFNEPSVGIMSPSRKVGNETTISQCLKKNVGYDPAARSRVLARTIDVHHHTKFTMSSTGHNLLENSLLMKNFVFWTVYRQFFESTLDANLSSSGQQALRTVVAVLFLQSRMALVSHCTKRTFVSFQNVLTTAVDWDPASSLAGSNDGSSPPRDFCRQISFQCQGKRRTLEKDAKVDPTTGDLFVPLCACSSQPRSVDAPSFAPPTTTTHLVVGVHEEEMPSSSARRNNEYCMLFTIFVILLFLAVVNQMIWVRLVMAKST